MFPECELGPGERWLLAFHLFPFQTDICVPFDTEQNFSPSVAAAEVNRNTRSGQCLIFRPLKCLQADLQNSFLDQCATLPDSLSLV